MLRGGLVLTQMQQTEHQLAGSFLPSHEIQHELYRVYDVWALWGWGGGVAWVLHKSSLFFLEFSTSSETGTRGTQIEVTLSATALKSCGSAWLYISGQKDFLVPHSGERPAPRPRHRHRRMPVGLPTEAGS